MNTTSLKLRSTRKIVKNIIKTLALTAVLSANLVNLSAVVPNVQCLKQAPGSGHCGYYATYFAHCFVTNQNPNNPARLDQIIPRRDLHNLSEDQVGAIVKTFDPNIQNQIIVANIEELQEVRKQKHEHPETIKGFIRFMQNIYHCQATGRPFAIIFNTDGHWVTYGVRKEGDKLVAQKSDSANQPIATQNIDKQIEDFIEKFSINRNECPICNDNIDPNTELLSLSCCGYILCKTCFNRTFRIKEVIDHAAQENTQVIAEGLVRDGTIQQAQIQQYLEEAARHANGYKKIIEGACPQCRKENIKTLSFSMQNGSVAQVQQQAPRIAQQPARPVAPAPQMPQLPSEDEQFAWAMAHADEAQLHGFEGDDPELAAVIAASLDPRNQGRLDEGFDANGGLSEDQALARVLALTADQAQAPIQAGPPRNIHQLLGETMRQLDALQIQVDQAGQDRILKAIQKGEEPEEIVNYILDQIQQPQQPAAPRQAQQAPAQRQRAEALIAELEGAKAQVELLFINTPQIAIETFNTKLQETKDLYPTINISNIIKTFEAGTSMYVVLGKYDQLLHEIYHKIQ